MRLKEKTEKYRCNKDLIFLRQQFILKHTSAAFRKYNKMCVESHCYLSDDEDVCSGCAKNRTCSNAPNSSENKSLCVSQVSCCSFPHLSGTAMLSHLSLRLVCGST
ncbi:hypothetical protein GOODEAATRI_020081 [Goodea atripinnis]|uniref:Uncharacterized protein n=1 Tax=Goodea atripinnis TaxID=208336 RepID=A0ABV0MTN0_9TELE